jgi:hypothetical protein
VDGLGPNCFRPALPRLGSTLNSKRFRLSLADLPSPSVKRGEMMVGLTTLLSHKKVSLQ